MMRNVFEVPFLTIGLVLWVPGVQAWVAEKRRPTKSIGGSRTTTRAFLTTTHEHVPLLLDTAYRLGQENKPANQENNDDPQQSFVNYMGVPTFSIAADNSAPALPVPIDRPVTARSVPGVEPPPAVVLDHVLDHSTCQAIIDACESNDASCLSFADYQAGKNHHGALQLVVPSSWTDALAQRIAPFIDVAAVQALDTQMAHTLGQTSVSSSLQFAGLNQRWRLYRYAPGGVQSFAPHIDAAFPPSGLTTDGTDLVWDVSHGTVVSRLTLLLYLNDDFEGGETVFYAPTSNTDDAQATDDTPTLVHAVRPVTGSILLFPQAVGEDAVAYARKAWPLHEGSPVQSGSPKYVIRSDVLFTSA